MKCFNKRHRVTTVSTSLKLEIKGCERGMERSKVKKRRGKLLFLVTKSKRGLADSKTFCLFQHISIIFAAKILPTLPEILTSRLKYKKPKRCQNKKKGMKTCTYPRNTRPVIWHWN